MGALGVEDHARVEVPQVVRADDAGPRVRERLVDESLVAMALGDLLGGPAGPDRLAHEPDGPVTPGVDELTDERQDPRRVRPLLAHIGEPDLGARAAERRAKDVQVPSGDGHHHRLVRVESRPHERVHR